MRIAAVCPLGFHYWILEGLVKELKKNHEVRWYVHHPGKKGDWLTSGSSSATTLLNSLEESNSDLVLTAEYPYEVLRRRANAPVVTVRHSLASRNNTWERDQEDADWIVTWSEWDEALFKKRRIRPRQGFLRGGCVWLEQLFNRRMIARRKFHTKFDTLVTKPTVLWAPTWNSELSCRETVVTELLELRGAYNIVIRPHGATHFLDSQWYNRMRKQKGVLFMSGGTPPHSMLLAADVLVTDVSGFGLLPLGLLEQDIPHILIDAPTSLLRRSKQFDPDGPEWVFRDELGVRCEGGRNLANMIKYAKFPSSEYGNLDEVRNTLLGGRKWMETACQRTAALITDLESDGTLGQTVMTS